MRNSGFLLACAVFFGLLSTPQFASAAPFIYDENISGDIDQNFFDFDFGLNTVRGTVSFENGVSDFDFFSAALPEDAVLKSVSISLMTGAGDTSNDFAGVFGLSIRNPPFTIGGGSDLGIRTDEGGDFILPVDLVARFLFFVGFNSLPAGVTGIDPFIFVNDYEVAFEVVPVPLPGAFGFFAFALAAGGFFSRLKAMKANA